MFQRIYQKFQTREGLFLLISLAIAVGIIVFILSYFGFGRYQSTIPSTITVSGTGEMNVSPDIARFTVSVTRDAATIAEARNQVATVTDPLLDQLKTAGIAERDIKTEGFNAYPKYENQSVRMCTINYCPPSNPVIVGYTVTTTYSVKVRDLDQVSQIAQLITDAQVSSVDGPSFEVDDIKKVQNDARSKAIADARTQSKILARQLGVKLGRVVDFQAGGNNYYPMYDRVMSAESQATGSGNTPDLPPGEKNVKSEVTITYRIR